MDEYGIAKGLLCRCGVGSSDADDARQGGDHVRLRAGLPVHARGLPDGRARRRARCRHVDVATRRHRRAASRRPRQFDYVSTCGIPLMSAVYQDGQNCPYLLLTCCLEQCYCTRLGFSENDFSGFLDPKNLAKDTKFITPRQMQMELYRM